MTTVARRKKKIMFGSERWRTLRRKIEIKGPEILRNEEVAVRFLKRIWPKWSDPERSLAYLQQ